MNDEPQHLCSERERLEIAIDRTRGGNDDEPMLHRRHTLQHELFVALPRQAELEEIERMEVTIKRAVEKNSWRILPYHQNQKWASNADLDSKTCDHPSLPPFFGSGELRRRDIQRLQFTCQRVLDRGQDYFV
jgi:hypothetical protein